uniref:RING-type domain-containing protein n=1 Tax=Anser brachyrhynchus TaxID=132585 RepID=A0A8B9C1U0_9AVES
MVEDYVMPCLHQFYFQCIQQWVESKPECPLCKRRVSSIVHLVWADNTSVWGSFRLYHSQLWQLECKKIMSWKRKQTLLTSDGVYLET